MELFNFTGSKLWLRQRQLVSTVHCTALQCWEILWPLFAGLWRNDRGLKFFASSYANLPYILTYNKIQWPYKLVVRLGADISPYKIHLRPHEQATFGVNVHACCSVSSHIGNNSLRIFCRRWSWCVWLASCCSSMWRRSMQSSSQMWRLNMWALASWEGW